MSQCPKPICIDFETEGILPRPEYPPKPVGVSIKAWGKRAKYYAWGHPDKNNCTFEQAKAALLEAWQSHELLFHNAKFDLEVAEKFFGVSRLPWQSVHDTLFLLFLDDPHQKQLSLKPSAERLLGQAPDERDAVKDWLLGYQPLKAQGIKISDAAGSEHYWAKYICLAPGTLVGQYANGDTKRTEDLFAMLWPKTRDRKMLEAYDRERELLPILMDNEKQGVRVDLPRLQQDVKDYKDWLNEVDAWIVDDLRAPGDINLNSGQQLVDAMLKAGKADSSLLGTTGGGKPKTDKDSLLAGVTDKRLLAMLKYRTQLGTCLQTFMEPWLATALKSGGRIFTNWNQVMGDEGGTRTGRLSSRPNFQNIPKTFKPIFYQEAPWDELPECPVAGLPPLPKVRGYILPEEGNVLVDRDYSQQELRVLAHFEDGELLAQYQADPWMDVHDYVLQMVNKMTGKEFDRGLIKTANFGLIYGMGVGLLAQRAGVDVEMAKEVKEAILDLLPGLKDISQDMKRRFMDNKPMRTWGGREYYCEPSKTVEGRLLTFDYKMINYLVQGSSADCTKEAILAYSRAQPKGHRLLLSVHDELLLSIPKAEVTAGMEALRVAMEGVQLDVPLLSEGRVSFTNWADLKPYDNKGVRVC